MRRSWVVRPDQELQTIVPDGEGGHLPGPVIGVVSKNALLEAVVDATIVAHRIGGVFEVVVNRQETGVQGERATTAAMVAWKDRTDARRAPEPDVQPIDLGTPEFVEEGLSPIEDTGERVAVTADGTEVDVDESDVPEHLRGL